MPSLITRLETATGPDAKLDLDIHNAMGFGRAPLNYTTSIDAALTLLIEGWQHGYATITQDDILRAANHLAQAYVDGSEMRDFSKYFRSEAATPAIALCIACLKARGVTE